MILLDFYSASHGHFLEYLINAYIFKGPRVEQVFTDLGTSHGIRNDQQYQLQRKVIAGHYTEFNVVVPDPTQVVRITVATEMEKVCYQLNIVHRARDIPIEKKLLAVPQEIRNDPTALRNDCMSKLIDHGYKLPSQWRWQDQAEIFEFPMQNLYNLLDLYSTLKKLANFLGHSFNPDQSLVELWETFIEKNHGVQHWIQAQNLLHNSLSNQNYTFQSTPWQQAVLNYMLINTIGIEDGPLFENDDYPTNTQEIFYIIQQYINNYDSRF